MAVWQFMGKGIVSLREAGTTGAFVDLGNVLDLKLTASETVKEQKNMRDSSGGAAATSRKIDKVELSMTLGEASPENLSLGFQAVKDVALGIHTIELFAESSKVYEVKFEGLNELNDGKRFDAEFFRVRFGPASNLDFINEDIATLPLKATIERDATKTGTGISKFAKLTIEE